MSAPPPAAAGRAFVFPFPGLRPFQPGEEHMFFGRESQVHTMVDRLARARILAVVGSSGSGKSSLVNCGLRPALHHGLMAKAGSAWRVAHFRPGGNPIREMALALARDGLAFDGLDTMGVPLEDMTEATLRMSRLGLVDLYQEAYPRGGPNLLVVADQFEELFRFRQTAGPGVRSGRGARQDAVAFVNLLLEAHRQRAFPIYVVLTMRSDFLGDCAQIPGLAEAINEGQYLVPRLTRDERRLAITGPVAVGGGRICPTLASRLVNDAGDNPDQLSVLQHALNRTWMRWQKYGEPDSMITPAQYTEIGTMAQALDTHADKAYGELTSDRERLICEKMFRALTDMGSDGRGVRRPTRLGVLCALCEASEAELVRVIDVFRKPSRSFLMPPIAEALHADSVVDISHESLMRVWKRLSTWKEEEARSVRLFRRLVESAGLFERGQTSLAQDPELQTALNWREEARPSAIWADRYGGGLDSAMHFLDASEAKRAHEREEAAARHKRRTLRAQVTLGSIVVAALFLSYAGAHRKATLAHAGEVAAQQRAFEAYATVATTIALTEHQERVLTSVQDATYFAADEVRSPGLFSVRGGLEVKVSSGAANPEVMFGGGASEDAKGGSADVATFFADGRPAGYRHWIEWDTRDVVRPGAVEIVAGHDGQTPEGFRLRRAFSRFILSSRIAGENEWTQLVDFTPPLPYGQGLSETTLAVCLALESPRSANQFRAEFVQAVDVYGQFSGPRVIRLDATASGCP